MNKTEDQGARQGKYVEANGLNIYYEEHGEGHPLILLHGGTATVTSWDERMPMLSKHFRVLALDTRGHGKTDNPAGKMTYGMLADDVAAFAQALNLEKPLIFGYSDGGQVALELGIKYPDLASALVLGGTAYKFGQQYFDALDGWGVHKTGIDLEEMERDSADWIEYLKAEHNRPDNPDYWQTLMQQISELWWSVKDYSAEELQKITAPTLILQGDRDEGVDIEQTVEMYRAIPNAELAVLPNATHGALNETAYQTVIDFLLRRSSGAISEADSDQKGTSA